MRYSLRGGCKDYQSPQALCHHCLSFGDLVKQACELGELSLAKITLSPYLLYTTALASLAIKEQIYLFLVYV